MQTVNSQPKGILSKRIILTPTILAIECLWPLKILFNERKDAIIGSAIWNTTRGGSVLEKESREVTVTDDKIHHNCWIPSSYLNRKEHYVACVSEFCTKSHIYILENLLSGFKDLKLLC